MVHWAQVEQQKQRDTHSARQKYNYISTQRCTEICRPIFGC